MLREVSTVGKSIRTQVALVGLLLAVSGEMLSDAAEIPFERSRNALERSRICRLWVQSTRADNL